MIAAWILCLLRSDAGKTPLKRRLGCRPVGIRPIDRQFSPFRTSSLVMKFQGNRFTKISGPPAYHPSNEGTVRSSMRRWWLDLMSSTCNSNKASLSETRQTTPDKRLTSHPSDRRHSSQLLTRGWLFLFQASHPLYNRQTTTT